MGKTIDNLNALIRAPTGCGEQNMVKFVPNILVLDYLTERDALEERVKQKAIDNINSGYQNQLRFKQKDNSFGVWEKSNGSVFLTAFVAKSFKIAHKYKNDIDPSIVSQAFDWLAKQQKENGSFYEVGTIFSAEIQGGLRKTNFALTAYVLAAFVETEKVAIQYNATVQKSVDYLVKNFDTMDHPYDLAIATYALSLLEHSPKIKFLNKLIDFSIFNETTSLRYWESGALSIEIAGYALLSHIAQKRTLDSTPIMNWLNTKRYDLGAFSGTQDTFVGLKALTQFAAHTSLRRNDYQVSINNKKVGGGGKTFDVRSSTTKHQEVTLDSDWRKLYVTVAGFGNGLYQVLLEYSRSIMKEEAGFNLSVNLMNTTTEYVQHLSVCVSYKPNEAYKTSNMATVEITQPSGFVGERESVKDKSRNKSIKKVETKFNGAAFVVYYTSIGVEPYCFDVITERRFKVALHRPAYVKVEDYYDNSRFAIQRYEGKIMQPCDVCEGEDCSLLSC